MRLLAGWGPWLAATGNSAAHQLALASSHRHLLSLLPYPTALAHLLQGCCLDLMVPPCCCRHQHLSPHPLVAPPLLVSYCRYCLELMVPNEEFAEFVRQGTDTGSLAADDMCVLASIGCR